MSDSSLRLDLQALLAETGWVRELARRLASDASEAADLEQRTWVAALRSKRREGVPLREWLGAIVRNFARQQKRGEARRREHEVRAARPEQVASVSEVVERAELQRKLVDAVMQLAEPYRTAILLRYFDGLPPRAIAARTGAPVATVRTHLARGLDKLRARFDDEHHGDRAAWLLAFAPLVARPVPISMSIVGGSLAMNTKLVLAAVALAVVGAGWWFAARDRGAAPDQVVAATNAEPARKSASSSGSSGGGSDSNDERNAVASAPATKHASSAAPTTAPAKRAVHGRVLDALGHSAAAVKLIARGESGAETALVSDQHGAFELADGPESGVIVSADPMLTTVLRASFHAAASPAHEPIVVVAPRLTFAGNVVDEQGAVLAGAAMRLELSADFRSRFNEVLDRSASIEWRTTSESDGTYELDGVPQIDGARLLTELDGFDADSRAEPTASDLHLAIVLARPRSTDGMLRGKVVDSSGAAVPGARVAFGFDSVTTAADGLFAFRIEDPKSLSTRFGMAPKSIVAVQRGFLPARFEPPTVDAKPAWPAYVTLRLGGTPLALSGRVVDAAGKPFGGARVWIADATLFGAVGEHAAQLESLLAGDDQNSWHSVEAGADGSFEIEGLLERDYVLRAMDPATLLRGETHPVRAGERDVEIRLPTDQLYERVAGRVVSQAGRAIGGVRVYPMCDAFQARAEGQIIGTSHSALQGVATDGDGRFELRNVPRSLVYLRIDGDAILPLEYGRYVEGDARFEHTAVRELPKDKIEQLEIVVEQRCHMQVELADAAFADELAVLDGAGHELVLSLYDGNSRREKLHQPIHEGRSDVLAVPDTGHTLVLFRTGAEVGRAPVQLEPGKLTTVRQ
jgi:RNA polymerase sigma-70 factor (ECF subfamily)